MAQAPNPSKVPLTGPGGYMTSEWIRWLTAPPAGPTVETLLARIELLEARVAALEAAP